MNNISPKMGVEKKKSAHMYLRGGLGGNPQKGVMCLA
jgi:hypothetical protein